MRNSALFFMATVMGIAVMTTSASADINKGQKWYTKNCKECHGTGTKGAAMLTQNEWDDFFANNGEMIMKKHVGTKAESYFHGDRFKDQAEHLRDFLFEYGSDSGNVPAC